MLIRCPACARHVRASEPSSVSAVYGFPGDFGPRDPGNDDAGRFPADPEAGTFDATDAQNDADALDDADAGTDDAD